MGARRAALRLCGPSRCPKHSRRPPSHGEAGYRPKPCPAESHPARPGAPGGGGKPGRQQTLRVPGGGCWRVSPPSGTGARERPRPSSSPALASSPSRVPRPPPRGAGLGRAQVSAAGQVRRPPAGRAPSAPCAPVAGRPAKEGTRGSSGRAVRPPPRQPPPMKSLLVSPERWAVRQEGGTPQEPPGQGTAPPPPPPPPTTPAGPGRDARLNGAILEVHPSPSATSLTQPQIPFRVQPVTPVAPDASPARETWGGKYEFLLSCVGYCVGLGNVWRFPYLCYRNGGGVFLIPYAIMLLFTGLPLFLMELSLGQYGAAGPITVWKCCPLLKGIGIGMLLVSSLVSLYYNVIIAWTFYYLAMSLHSPLPWSCDAPENALLCQPQNTSSGNISRVSASEAFWNEQVLGVTHSSGLGDPGPVRWPLALCLLLAWMVIFFCTLKGIRSSGKVVYFTATFPYVVILVLIVRGATLEGSIDGVRFYLSTDWSRLGSAQVWNDAASQIFYSLGIGFGGLLSMASYNKFDNNVIRDTLVIAIGNCCTSFFAGFAIFSILGHMAWRKKVPVGKVADSGPGLAFVAYPEALALLPGSAFWSVLFFLMLFTLGVDTLFGNMEGISTAVLDEFPSLREWRRKAVFLGLLCLAFYLMGLLLITEGGIYWFTLIDAYSTSFGLIIIVLFMCLGVAFFYGVNQFCQDIVDMISRCPPWCSQLVAYFKACWTIFTPGLLLFTLFYIFLDLSSTTLHYGTYEYPPWGEALGVCMGVVTCIQIPLWAGIALFKETGTLADRFRKAICPLNSWRTATGRDLSQAVIDVPYTVNLTDNDFNGQWELPDSSEA